MNNNELELLLTASLKSTKEPDSKLNLETLNQAKIKCNQEYQLKQDQKSLVLALSVLLPFSIFVTVVVSYLFISNFFAKLFIMGFGIIGIFCILIVGRVAFTTMKKQKGVLAE
ncbi:MAG: hypothetical protein GX567_10645 [Clostridia bacterium]|nr:hypothetical protein [Clostridia bacterium]